MASSSPHNHEGSALPGKNLGLNPETVANLTLQSVKGLSWVWTGLPIDITNKTLAYWTNSQKILNIQPEPPWFGGPYWGYHNRGLDQLPRLPRCQANAVGGPRAPDSPQQVERQVIDSPRRHILSHKKPPIIVLTNHTNSMVISGS